MAKARDLRLDVLKALAIALVVFGHVVRLVYVDASRAPVLLGSAFSLLALLDVPLFVFVSGYLARPDADARWLGRRALQLLVPYAVWSVLRWLVYYRDDAWGWFVRVAVWRNETPAVWFLYALFVVCALYWLVRRSRPLMVGLALVLALVPPTALPYFSLRYIALLFPVFVAGRLAGERRFEPGAWVLGLAAVLTAVMWSGAGANLIFATPAWAVPLTRASAGWTWLPAAMLVNVLRMALALSLIASAFFLVRRVKQGAWLGALTLGVYCSHPFFLPAWARHGGVPEVVAAYTLTLAAAVGVTLLLQRWETTSFLLLGSGVPPAWVRRRLPAR